jgi:hypothetical protein
MHWFSCAGESADRGTGMWVVNSDFLEDGESYASVIHLDTILRTAHLLPVFKEGFVSRTLTFSDTLDEFWAFYVNKYVDHHAFKITF